MQARPLLVGRVPGCAVAALSLGVAVGLVPAAGARSAKVGALYGISAASPLPASCAVPGTPIRDFEVEPTLAVDPRRPGRLVASRQQDRLRDLDGAVSNVTASSRDGGRQWRTRLVPGVSRCTGGVFPGANDPWLSIGPDGTSYLASLHVAGIAAPALLINRSRDVGRSWSRPVYVDRRADPLAFDDNGAVTANRYRPGVAYLAWAQNRPVPTPTGVARVRDLYFDRTKNRGRSWTRPAWIYEASPLESVVSSLVIATGRRRLVCEFSIGVKSEAPPVAGNPVTFRALRSHDGGRSWSAPSRIAATRGISLTDHERGTQLRAPSPHFSADGGPRRLVYLAWQSVRSSASSRILLSVSRGGRRWSRPGLVSRRARSPFTPDLAVGSDGTVGVRFYDLRRDRPGDDALTTDSWFRHSHDHGRHWREARLGRSFDLRTAPVAGGATPGRLLGDYQALAALPGGFATVFARARPAARRGPTDIFFARIELRR